MNFPQVFVWCISRVVLGVGRGRQHFSRILEIRELQTGVDKLMIPFTLLGITVSLGYSLHFFQSSLPSAVVVFRTGPPYRWETTSDHTSEAASQLVPARGHRRPDALDPSASRKLLDQLLVPVSSARVGVHFSDADDKELTAIYNELRWMQNLKSVLPKRMGAETGGRPGGQKHVILDVGTGVGTVVGFML